MNERIKEFTCFIACIAFIVFVGYISGILKGFSVNDFANAYGELAQVIKINLVGYDKYINVEKSPRRKVSTYKNYRPRIIPNNVLAGSASSVTWTNLFNSSRKVIFYVYDDNADFHNAISSYYTKRQLYKYYEFEPYRRSIFDGMRTGEIGPAKICNSIEECNKVRKKAVDYTVLMDFLNKCGNTMCVFKPSQNQYIQLKKRNTAEAYKLLDTLKNW